MGIMTNDKEVTLTCITSSPWFFCVWEGPGGDRACALRDKMGKQGESLCGEQDRLVVKGNSSMCSLVIKNPEISDHGDWTCAVSDDDSLELVKDVVQLGSQGTLEIMPSKIELSEGGQIDQVELVCMVEEAFPLPEISWKVSRDMMGTLDTSSNKMTIPSNKSHMVSIQHVVFYTPSLLDHGMNISCMASQGNMSKQVQIVVVRFRGPEEEAILGLFVGLMIMFSIILIIKMKKRKSNGYGLIENELIVMDRQDGDQ